MMGAGQRASLSGDGFPVIEKGATLQDVFQGTSHLEALDGHSAS